MTAMDFGLLRFWQEEFAKSGKTVDEYIEHIRQPHYGFTEEQIC
ncbi:MAG: hypothetical protein ACOCQD_00885 [archaeon]